MKWTRVRLRTILLLINVVILALPLGGIIWLRLYESALVRQTESELIAQGVFIASAYQSMLARAAQPAAFSYAGYGRAVTAALPPAEPGRWHPRLAQLDLATDPVYPKPPEPAAAAQPADSVAGQVGRELTPILRNAQLATLAGIRVVDFNGVIVASTSEDFGLSLANHDEVSRALTGEPVSFMRWRTNDTPPPPLDSISRGTRIRVFVAVPIVHEDRVLGAVLLARTPANIRQAVYGKRWPLLYAALTLLVIVLLFSLIVSLTISRPVQNLIAQARRAARGEQGAVVALKHPGTREIAELSETVAAMAQTLESRANYIRDFAAHVSHEFKTPLTAIQGAVELLRDHADTMSPEERTRFLNMLSTDAQRLENLVRRLLELARADVARVGDESSDLAAVLPVTAARYRELGLQVDVHDEPASVIVAMAPETLDSVVSNLLDNARQHAGAQARASIRWTAASSMAEIFVGDDGPGISAANAERVFQPFFTTARKAGNTGLGLAIIRSLLSAHAGDIALLSSEAVHSKGALFRIRLPLKISK